MTDKPGRVEPRSPREEVVIYAWGLVMMSVCAPASMDAHAVEDSANRQHPTGITSEWTVSREPFRGTSQVSPVACDTDADRRHWLLSC